jgi:hypothetical protein
VIFFTGGRDVIRRYEAKLYTEHEEGNVGAHIREGMLKPDEGNSSTARKLATTFGR